MDYILIKSQFGIMILMHSNAMIVSAYRYIATATLAIIAVFVEYLGKFLIDLNQIHRHSIVPKNTSLCIF